MLCIARLLIIIIIIIIEDKCRVMCFGHHEGKWGSGGIMPPILNRYSRQRRVISFTLRPIYHRESPPPPGGPQTQSGRFEEEHNLLLLPGIETRFLGHAAHSLFTIPTTIYRLLLLLLLLLLLTLKLRQLE
jgi:hypothetical protein